MAGVAVNGGAVGEGQAPQAGAGPGGGGDDAGGLSGLVQAFLADGQLGQGAGAVRGGDGGVGGQGFARSGQADQHQVGVGGRVPGDGGSVHAGAQGDGVGMGVLVGEIVGGGFGQGVGWAGQEDQAGGVGGVGGDVDELVARSGGDPFGAAAHIGHAQTGGQGEDGTVDGLVGGQFVDGERGGGLTGGRGGAGGGEDLPPVHVGQGATGLLVVDAGLGGVDAGVDGGLSVAGAGADAGPGGGQAGLDGGQFPGQIVDGDSAVQAQGGLPQVTVGGRVGHWAGVDEFGAGQAGRVEGLVDQASDQPGLRARPGRGAPGGGDVGDAGPGSPAGGGPADHEALGVAFTAAAVGVVEAGHRGERRALQGGGQFLLQAEHGLGRLSVEGDEGQVEHAGAVGQEAGAEEGPLGFGDDGGGLFDRGPAALPGRVLVHLVEEHGQSLGCGGGLLDLPGHGGQDRAGGVGFGVEGSDQDGVQSWGGQGLAAGEPGQVGSVVGGQGGQGRLAGGLADGHGPQAGRGLGGVHGGGLAGDHPLVRVDPSGQPGGLGA